MRHGMNKKFLVYDLEQNAFLNENENMLDEGERSKMQHAAVFSDESFKRLHSDKDLTQLKYLQMPMTQEFLDRLPFDLPDTDPQVLADQTMDIKEVYAKMYPEPLGIKKFSQDGVISSIKLFDDAHEFDPNNPIFYVFTNEGMVGYVKVAESNNGHAYMARAEHNFDMRFARAWDNSYELYRLEAEQQGYFTNSGLEAWDDGKARVVVPISYEAYQAYGKQDVSASLYTGDVYYNGWKVMDINDFVFAQEWYDENVYGTEYTVIAPVKDKRVLDQEPPNAVEVEDVTINGKALVYDLEQKGFLNGSNDMLDEEERGKMQNAVLFSQSSFKNQYPDIDLNASRYLVVPMPQTLLDALPFTLSDTDTQTPALPSIDNDEVMNKMNRDIQHETYGPKWLMMTDKGFIGRVDTCDYMNGWEPIRYNEMPTANNFDIRFAADMDDELATITEYIDCYNNHADGYFKALGIGSEGDLTCVMVPVTDEQIDGYFNQVVDSDLYKGDIYDINTHKIINIEDYRLTHSRVVQLTKEDMAEIMKPSPKEGEDIDDYRAKLQNEEPSFEDAIEQLSTEAKLSSGLEQ